MNYLRTIRSVHEAEKCIPLATGNFIIGSRKALRVRV